MTINEEILINMTPREVRAAVLDQGVLYELLIERASRRGLTGNIYKGRVSRALPGMQAAFIEMGLERTGFLHARDIQPSPRANTRRAVGVVLAHPPVLLELRTSTSSASLSIAEPYSSSDDPLSPSGHAGGVRACACHGRIRAGASASARGAGASASARAAHRRASSGARLRTSQPRTAACTRNA